MIVNSRSLFTGFLRRLVVRTLPVTLYILLVCWLDIKFHFEDLNFPPTILAVLGTVIALLLAFRTNSAYARWWEARIIWGRIVNDSRTWVRQLLSFARTESSNTGVDDPIHRLAYRQIAWCYALSRSLRGQDPFTDLDGLLPESEVESRRTSEHVPNAILLDQAIDLRALFESGRIELYQFVELEKTLTRLTDSMGGCERIRNTPFPPSYGMMVDVSVYLLVILLPFGLVNVPTAGLVFTSLSLAFALVAIDRVAVFLQDPFSNSASDTPVLALSRTIEINIKQMLGEADVPQKLEPVDGVLS